MGYNQDDEVEDQLVNLKQREVLLLDVIMVMVD